MISVNIDAVQPCFSVKRPGGDTGLQIPAAAFSPRLWDVYGSRSLINEMKVAGYRGKGQAASMNPLAQVGDSPAFVQVVSQEGTIGGKVAADGFRIAGICAVRQDFPGRADAGAKQPWRRSLPGEPGDYAVFRRFFPLPVAAASRLQNRIQPGQLPVNCRETDVHPSFNEGGGNQPAGQILGQPFPDFVQHRLSVGGIHQCG